MLKQDNYLIPLQGDISIDDISLVGGKGGNLIILTKHGFNVPDGFVVTTNAYRLLVKENNLDQFIQTVLADHDLSDPSQLAKASDEIRNAFKEAAFPSVVTKLVEHSYHRMGSPPVAVRSSAITEDLPDLSFAGQHDTILNVTTLEDLIQAVLTCFSSLWTARSIGYRHENKIPQEGLAMAVVVQEMIPSELSGVMFTANPVTGKRGEIVIEAIRGLGEALVAGMVEPDEFLVDERDHVISKKVGKKELVIELASGGGTVKRTLDETLKKTLTLDETLILELSRIGRAIESVYGHPQDIEWAIKDREIFILQSRPITTLHPVPNEVARRPLQVYMSFNAVQGVMEPFTPLGSDVFQHLIKEVLMRLKIVNKDFAIESFLALAGSRLWVNLTPIVRDPMGRRLVHRGFLTMAERDIRDIITELLDDPDLQLVRRVPLTRTHRQVMRILAVIWKGVIEALRNPRRIRQQKVNDFETLLRRIQETNHQLTGSMEKIRYNRILFQILPHAMITFLPLLIAGYFPLLLVQRLVSPHLEERETDLLLELTRALPSNVTTAMDLELWETAMRIKKDEDAMNFLLKSTDEELLRAHRTRTLPSTLQDAIQDFLDKYWGRGLVEIDVGRPRWREQPQAVFNALKSYVQLDEASPHAPVNMFRQGKHEAHQAYLTLRDKLKSTRGAWIKLHLMDGAVKRLRTLAGIREYPKFAIVRVFTLMRNNFLDVGNDLRDRGVLEETNEVFYLTMDEIEQALTTDHETVIQGLKKAIRSRKAEYEREFYRKRVPKVLLSDGRVFFENPRLEHHGKHATVLRGTGVSPGRYEGRVRVLRTPLEDQLLSGEILVCPATDPSWTPLFAAARGLIMEVGGLMTHGSVVARELGIPAVVGVANATNILKSGQRVVLDGSKGLIILKSSETTD